MYVVNGVILEKVWGSGECGVEATVGVSSVSSMYCTCTSYRSIGSPLLNRGGFHSNTMMLFQKIKNRRTHFHKM